MENLLTFTGIIMIAFGILQIILFFKIWGMTNDIRNIKDGFSNGSYSIKIEGFKEMKDKYMKDGHTNTDSLSKESYKNRSDESNSHSKENVVERHTTAPLIDAQAKEIDINSEDFTKLINRWKILKNRGFTKQAVNEYMEKTSLPIEDAETFINEL